MLAGNRVCLICVQSCYHIFVELLMKPRMRTVKRLQAYEEQRRAQGLRARGRRVDCGVAEAMKLERP